MKFPLLQDFKEHAYMRALVVETYTDFLSYMPRAHESVSYMYVSYMYAYIDTLLCRKKGDRIRWDFKSTRIWRISKANDLPLFPSPLLLTELIVKFFNCCNWDGIQLGMQAGFQGPNTNSITVNPVSLFMEDFFLLDQKKKTIHRVNYWGSREEVRGKGKMSSWKVDRVSSSEKDVVRGCVRNEWNQVFGC